METLKPFGRIKEKLSNVTLRSTVIVGFPGESAGDFSAPRFCKRRILTCRSLYLFKGRRNACVQVYGPCEKDTARDGMAQSWRYRKIFRNRLQSSPVALKTIVIS